MSQKISWNCDACRKTAETANAYTLPAGWLQHHAQGTRGQVQHACGAECMVLVLRGDAAVLELEERTRKADAADHAQRAEEARLAGLKRHDAVVLRQEELSRPGTGR
jgi:hypothetical protein